MSKRVMAIAMPLAMAVAIAGALALGGSASAQETTYAVTIENLTDGQPFTPPVIAVHSADMHIFETGSAASAALAQVAENGNNEPLVDALNSASAVSAVVTGDGPVMPGETATLTISAPAGMYLSAAFMLICTNDGFSGVDSLMLPASGSTTIDANAYDAGSEMNTEDFADIVPPCQGLIGVSSDDDGTGMSNADLAEGGVITMHGGIRGGYDLTVADHGWTGAVARITVSAGDGMMDDGMMDDGMMESVDTSLPPAGTGPIDSGNSLTWVYFVAIMGAALVVVGGAVRFARARAA